MKKKLIYIGIIVIIILMLGTVKVEAASAKLYASKSTAEVGDTVNITVEFTAAAWNLKVSGNGITSKPYISQTSDLNEAKTTDKIKLNTSKAGTYTISLTGDITDKDGNTKEVDTSVTVTVKAKTSTTTTASNVATLKNLGITPNDFTGFRAATTTYNVSVPNSVEKVSIYATPTDSKATVTGTGSKTLKVGKNTYSVKVTAEDKKTTKTYTLNITREEETAISTDATLKNLGITPNDFKGFKPATTSYSVTVPNSVEKINIYATPTNAKSTITGTGEQSLNVGENTFDVKVTAEDKTTTKTYTLKITREAETSETGGNTTEPTNTTADPGDTTQEPTSTSTEKGLTNLTVAGYTLSPKFDANIYEYKLEIPKDKDSLNITTETSDDNIKVDIIGNEYLQIGENVITVLVNEDGTDITTAYQITVNMLDKTAEEIATEEETNSSVEKDAQKQKIILIAAGVIIILVIAILLLGRSKERDYDEDEEDDENTDTYRDNQLEDWEELEAKQKDREPKTRSPKGKRFK